MNYPRGWLLFLILWLWLAVTLSVAAQAPGTATETPTPLPAVPIIQATPAPTAIPQGNLWQQVWAENQKAILLGLITVVIASILVGVFLRRLAESLSQAASRFFHFIFDRFASAPLLRLRYDRAYRETLAAGLQQLASSNIVNREVRLDRVYVPVQLTEETRGSGRAACVDLIEWDDDRRRRQAERAIAPWEAIRRFHRLVVLGEPGAGKTTYLTHLAFMTAQRQRLPGYTPIFLRLRDLAAVDRLEEALPAEFARWRFPNAGRYFQRQLAAGRCLILLDGLDEVASPAQHARVVDLVQQFADQYAPDEPHKAACGNIIAVSCRTYSYEHGSQLTGFAKTMVMDFDDSAIERFIHNWFGVGEEGPLADELVTRLNTNRRFKELARNPLLLLLITDHYSRDRSLPDVRAELYDHCVRTRITRWNTLKGTHRGRFGETDKRRMLRELALDLYRQEWRDLLDEEQLLAWLEQFTANLHLPDQVAPAELLDEVARTSGLLQERAIGRYGFSHQTLQEYFAADAVARLGPIEGAALLGKHLAEPRWQEVIFLYCGLADYADPLLRFVLDRAAEDGKPAWLQGGRCLAEGAKNVNPEVCGRVAAELVALLRRAEAGDRTSLTADESGEVAGWLGRFAADALPGHAATLLASGADHDALLAARLLSELPPAAESELRSQVSRRVAALAREGATAEQRAAAAAALGWVGGSQGLEAQTALIAGLADPDPEARAQAARGLGRLAVADDATVAALLRLYPADPADVARHAALEALLALGRAADVGMVAVPAGEFLLGSADDDRDAASNENPQHRVYLPAYYLDRTPVTNAQYRRFIEAGGYANPAYWKEAITAKRWKNGAYLEIKELGGKPRTQPVYWADPQWNSDPQPVVGVTWWEALAYARWAGKRLPSEAEWEKAASWAGEQGSGGAREQGKKRRYPWGDEWDPKKCNTKEGGPGKTTPVGAYSPAGDSPCDAADMAGNVWEWCSTRWGFSYPYAPNDGREDLGGGDDMGRVVRGGSWYHDQKVARCAYRSRYNPRYWHYLRGVRCGCSTSSPVSGSGS